MYLGYVIVTIIVYYLVTNLVLFITETGDKTANINAKT